MSTMTDSLPPLPTFLIIGAQKSATRWLRSNLGTHPDIYANPDEISYFNYPQRVRSKGIDWYRARFEGWKGEPIVGESTPGYMIWRHHPAEVAERIQQAVPDVRLIAVLRNPVDRAYSAMIHHIKRQRIPSDADLLKLVRATPPEQERFGLVTGGWYGTCLAPHVERFGDQLLVLLHDDVSADPATVYRASLQHLGADSSFQPPDLGKIQFSNRRTPAATRQRTLTQAERVELYGYFRDDIAQLEGLIGRDLSAWDPTAARADDARLAPTGPTGRQRRRGDTT